MAEVRAEKTQTLGSLAAALDGPPLDIDAELGVDTTGRPASRAGSESPEPPPAREPVAPEPPAPKEPAPPADERELSLEDGLDDTPAPAKPAAEEDAWIDELPEAHRDRVREQLRTIAGQKHALGRRAQRLQELEQERRTAIQVALQDRRALTDFVARNRTPGAETPPPDPSAKPAADEREMLEVEVDEHGNARLPLDTVLKALERRQAPQNARVQEVQQRAAYADRLLSEAQVDTPTQTRLGAAVRDMMQLYKGIVDTEYQGRPPAEGTAGDIRLMRDHGAEAELQKRYPGVDVEDLIDLVESMKNPVMQGHRLVKIARHYQREWAGADAPAAKPPPKPNLPNHPTSLGRRGGSGGETRRTLDEIGDLSLDDTLAKSPADLSAMFKAWELEMGERPTGYRGR